MSAISVKVLQAIVFGAAAQGEDSFGLHLSEHLPVDGLGPIGFAVRSSATVGEAYERVVRYLRLVAHGPELELRLDGGVARLRHEPPGRPRTRAAPPGCACGGRHATSPPAP